jgi:mannose-1-phosphate guanylyltransferase
VAPPRSMDACSRLSFVAATLILAAGLGTRLAPLSSWCAKPLVPIGDRPAIAHIVEQVRGRGPIVVNAHHRAEQVASYARSAGFEVSREEALLGTAGGLHAAGALLGAGDVLVWSGDMIGDLDVGALIAAHASEAARGAVATLVVRPRGDALGNTGLDSRGDVVRLRREAARDGEARTADFLAIYVVGDALRRSLPPKGDIIAEALLPAIRRGDRIAVFATDAVFIDVGTPRAYLEANLRWLARRAAGWWVGEGGRTDPSATLDGVVVGNGASVTGEGKVEGCVVWPGAVLRAPMANAVVAPEGVVRV